MCLFRSFFRVAVVNPYKPEPRLVFSKTTYGEFSYTVPDDARHVKIEIAGGNGNAAYAQQYAFGSGGRGGIIVILDDVIGSVAGKTITGTVGATATGSNGVGGQGAPSGTNGGHTTAGGSSCYGGGGGGATTITIDGTTYTASGGGGATFNDYYGGYHHAVGGTGGGPNGGTPGESINEQFVTTNGHNATDDIINATSGGYIKIWVDYETSLLFEKNTKGAFSFTVPNTVSVVAIEIAGGNGASGSIGGYSSGSGYYIFSGGKGAKKTIRVASANGKEITGIVGQSGGWSGLSTSAGYPDGTIGETKESMSPLAQSYGGGGGGHTEITVSETTYLVSGGAGGAAKSDNAAWAQGGTGGGPNGGRPTTNGAGGNATDGDELNQELNAYVKIYALA